ncbi:Zn(2+)-responsive transcriptional regulator [Thaumasiovibrio subtropicus]|uniref:Zn(2+)-responsive transcriptional regulator n=1 Tax=Thaumasiovibrio subtropicus TaxID=1891207 RepID=UPI000B354878|nr:Zn(2+)-responsive transcriptional regulator [Thaumasiovibrio subtropicus]
MYLIGQLAKSCGISSDALRFYEKQQLLVPAGRSASGYRLYDDQAVATIAFILRGKRVGLNLEEIKELLAIRLEATAHSCAEVKQITQHKLDDIESKIAELNAIRDALKTMNDACCGKVDDDASHCSILAALAAQK